MRFLCLLAALVPCAAVADEVVRPDDMARLCAERAPALRAALGRSRVPLASIDFEKFPPRRVGEGKHGEEILGGALRLGYVGAPRQENALFAAVRTLGKGKALQLADRQDGAAIYARLDLGEVFGGVAFDVESPGTK